jgi:hypothetical protein
MPTSDTAQTKTNRALTAPSELTVVCVRARLRIRTKWLLDSYMACHGGKWRGSITCCWLDDEARPALSAWTGWHPAAVRSALH